jgi:molybdopterin-guanine dinucleotide biosynthesis protein A
VIGIVLAGGAGRRMGGRKSERLLAGRPLASYPAAALAEVCERVALVGEGPELPGVELWDDEPAEPRHPLTGIVHALERADGNPILVCAADMPFVEPGTLRAIATAASDSVAVAVTGNRLQPVLALYTPAALPALMRAEPGEPLTRTVERLDPIRIEVPAAQARSIDTPEQLAEAEDELRAQQERRAADEEGDLAEGERDPQRRRAE